MPLLSFDDLFRAADALPAPVPIVAAGGADRTVLEALRRATDRGWTAPIVVGQERALREVAEAHGLRLDGFTLLDSDDPARAAVAEVRAGRARLLLKGQIATPDLMKAVLDPTSGLRTGRAIGQVVLMEIPHAARRFLLADTGILIHPTLEQKADLLRSLVEVARALGADQPRVAVLAATEKVNAAMPETLDAAELQRRGQASAFGNADVQGPLSFDLAYAAEAAASKRISGAVVGAADAMLFPDLTSANLTVKAIMYTAACRFGGILRGTSHPVVFMSRADSTATRLHSIALALKLMDM
ncbi:MAG: phosphate butyryltransferase [Isosphaeraceae bacterium]|nr:phosphate butyryltransferase [Isosphaeraceae bacterium]